MYAQDLCKRYGMCMETLLTAYAHYANYMEELPCGDLAYTIDEEGMKFFNDLTGKKEKKSYPSCQWCKSQIRNDGPCPDCGKSIGEDGH
jgi:hypothetical protein